VSLLVPVAPEDLVDPVHDFSGPEGAGPMADGGMGDGAVLGGHRNGPVRAKADDPGLDNRVGRLVGGTIKE